MKLSSLLSPARVKVFLRSVAKTDDPEIKTLDYDSRQVEGKSLFFAIRGFKKDGHAYLAKALRQGAVAVASEKPAPSDCAVPWIQVSSVRPFMASVASHFFGDPSQKLKLVGVTGTNGKTTTAFLVHSILSHQKPALMMGTMGTHLAGKSWVSERTTGESIDVQRILGEAVEARCVQGVLEVSSHALVLNRVYHCHVPVAIFTNLSQDHLDFHQNWNEYFQSKCLLFQNSYNPGLTHAVLNYDDPMSREVQPDGQILTFGMSQGADLWPFRRKTSVDGTQLEFDFQGRKLSLRSPLVGNHNSYNIMAAALACHALGISEDQIRWGISSLKRIPGRFEKVELGREFTVIVDYAHTPDALENVLRLCRSLSKGRVLCVFGCGGDRDVDKRPKMGEVSTRQADWTIITTDNPRDENPEVIWGQIISGIPGGRENFETIPDRREAIGHSLKLARPGDLILVAGKGHENYQEVQGIRVPFDDRDVVRDAV